MVRRYGVYAGKVRKQWQERPNIYSLAPESWQKGHPRESKIVPAIPQEKPETVQVSDAWSKLRKQSWARLLQKVYEVDPFVCPKCQGTMSVVAIIEDPKELAKIINWAKQQEREQPVAVCARSPPELALVSVYTAKNEVYADQDNTSKSEFIWLRGGVMCLSFVALTRIRG